MAKDQTSLTFSQRLARLRLVKAAKGREPRELRRRLAAARESLRAS